MPKVISKKKRNFIKKNFNLLSLEELCRQTGLKPNVIRSLIEKDVIKSSHDKDSHKHCPVYLQAVAAIVIVLLTITVYIPALQNDYIWDDDYYVTHNTTLRNADGLRRIWLEIGAIPQYYPLVHTTFWLEYHLWKLQPFGYHLINVLLHALNAVLLWLLLRRLSIPGAWTAALVFAVHPVHVESVAWITERKNVLSACFYLSAVLAYLRFTELDHDYASTPSGTRLHASKVNQSPWRSYWLALVLYICALLSKTVTCTMPVAILILQWWKQGRIRLRNVLLLIPLFLAGFALSMTTIWLEKTHVGAQGEAWTFSFIERFILAGRALCFYAGKIFWPYNLTFIYPRWQIDAEIWWQYLFLSAAGAVFVILWLFSRRTSKAPLAAVLFFGLTLSPALGFIDFYPMRYSFVADHFQYLASIGLIVLCVALIMKCLGRLTPLPRKIGYTAFGVIIFLLGILVWQQGHVYKNSETLWRDTILKNPGAWMAHNNLGNVLAEQGKIDDAIEFFLQALKLKPDNIETHVSLGSAYLIKGMRDKAVSEYKKALAVNPGHLKARTNLGAAYSQKGLLSQAISEYKQVLAVNPGHAAAHYNLAYAYEKMDELDDAISEYLKAIDLKPDYAEAHNNLSVAYYYKDNPQMAIIHCDKAAALGFSVKPKLLELLKPYRE